MNFVKLMKWLAAVLLMFFCLSGESQNLLENPVLNQYFLSIYQTGCAPDSLPEIDTARQDWAMINRIWWKLISGENTPELNADITAIHEKYKAKKEKPEESSDLYVFLLTMTGGYKARADALNNEGFQAARGYYALVPYYNYILKNADRNDEFALMAGLYHLAMEEVKSKGLVALPFLWMMPKADKAQGEIYMARALASTHPVIRTEALYFSYKINAEVYNNPRLATKYLNELLSLYPENVVYRICRIRLQNEMGVKNGDFVLKTGSIIKNHSHLSEVQKKHFLQLLADDLASAKANSRGRRN